MNLLRTVISLIWAALVGQRHFINDFVTPVLQFIEQLKNLKPEEHGEKWDYKQHFVDNLNFSKLVKHRSKGNKSFSFDKWALDWISNLVTIFINAIKAVLPEQYKALEKKTHAAILLWFSSYVQQLDKVQRAMILQRVASFMVQQIWVYKDKKLSTTEADLITQITYAQSKTDPTILG